MLFISHIFSRMDKVSKENYRKKYKSIKKYGNTAAISTIGISEGKELVKDIINSKLKAYGYKSVFAIALGPVMQVISVPLYVLSYSTKLRKFAVATAQFGAMILKGEMGIINWGWVGLDLVLFGEPVPVTDDSEYLFIVHNETVNSFAQIINEGMD